MSDSVTVATTDDLEPGENTVVEANGQEIALFNVDGEYHAIGNSCSHMGGPLGDGDLTDDTVSCPWHGAEFDVTSGEALTDPAAGDVERHEVRVEGSDVVVEV